jgi:hypothetical protein
MRVMDGFKAFKWERPSAACRCGLEALEKAGRLVFLPPCIILGLSSVLS